MNINHENAELRARAGSYAIFQMCVSMKMILYLTAKETHIFNIHLITETLIKFYP